MENSNKEVVIPKKINTALYEDEENKTIVADTIYCECSDKCSLYANGKCLRVRRLFREYCPYGRVEQDKRYAKRLNSGWKKWREQYTNDSVYKKLKAIYKYCFAVIGDYYYLETGCVGAKFDETGKLDIKCNTGYSFLEKSRCTAETFVKILTFKAKNCWGTEIKEYAEDIAPRILKDIQSECPELYKEIIRLEPALDKKFNYVGKTVYVNTMTEGSVLTDFRGNQLVLKNGELICKDYNGSFSFGAEKAKIVIPVTDKMTYKVTDKAQINENTKLAD